MQAVSSYSATGSSFSKLNSKKKTLNSTESVGFKRLLREMTSPRRIAIGLTVAFAPMFIASLLRGDKPDTHQHLNDVNIDWQEILKDLSFYFLRLVSVMLAAIFLDNIVPKVKLHKPGELHIHKINDVNDEHNHNHNELEAHDHHHEEADPAKSNWLEVKATDAIQKGGLKEAFKDTFNKTNLSLAFSIAAFNTIVEGVQTWFVHQVDTVGQAWVSLIGALSKVLGTFITARFIIGREEFKTAGDMLKNWDKLITGFVCPCHGTMICMTEIEAIIQSVLQLFKAKTNSPRS